LIWTFSTYFYLANRGGFFRLKPDFSKQVRSALLREPPSSDFPNGRCLRLKEVAETVLARPEARKDAEPQNADA
jgi:hypothetical protein